MVLPESLRLKENTAGAQAEGKSISYSWRAFTDAPME